MIKVYRGSDGNYHISKGEHSYCGCFYTTKLVDVEQYAPSSHHNSTYLERRDRDGMEEYTPDMFFDLCHDCYTRMISYGEYLPSSHISKFDIVRFKEPRLNMFGEPLDVIGTINASEFAEECKDDVIVLSVTNGLCEVQFLESGLTGKLSVDRFYKKLR